MCGITGIVSLNGAPPPDSRRLRTMCDTLYHRGPDSDGMDVDRGVAIGMRRLSIIDTAGGRQPLFNEDRTVRVVFNGEIYNFRALRTDLERRGHRFATSTDGEVITHLWEEYGADFPAHLNGMFAIALHDTRQGRFVLVRDRLGIKPLYYALSPHHLVFGSEVKAILASGLIRTSLDLDNLGQFLAWEYVPAPGTLFREVRKLEPACLLEVDLGTGRIRQRRYWEVPRPGETKGSPRTHGEWLEAVDAQVRASVRSQLISDVPLGAFLSGGVDSSLVVSAMGDARTFSIGFDDPSYNELAWSRRVADHLRVQHETEVLRPKVLELFERLMHYLDDPIGDFSIFPTFLVSRLARSRVTVVLSGDGGDEVFGGYETYVADELARYWRLVPGPFRRGVLEPLMHRLSPRPEKKGLVNMARRFAEGLSHESTPGHARWRQFLDVHGRSELFTTASLKEIQTPIDAHVRRLAREAGRRSDVDRNLYVDLKSYLVDNCLVKMDRMSMACSLEARVPLLDHELVELAFSMPDRFKVHLGKTKVLLKEVAARHVPRACVYRPKEGFSIPIKHWLGNELRPVMEELLSRNRLEAEGIFRPDTVARLKAEHLEGRANHSHLLWSLMVFQDWRRRWLV